MSEELWSSRPQELVWGKDEEEKIFNLFITARTLIREEEEVQLVYGMGKPELGSDDPIENMLDAEYYRFMFESENPLYLEMKEKQKAFSEQVHHLMKENLLFLAFSLVEKRQTLCDTHELFKRYLTWDEVRDHLNRLNEKLEKLGDIKSKTLVQLGENLRHVI